MAKSLLKKLSGSGFTGLNLLLRKFGYRVERLDQMNFFEPLLYRRLARNPSFIFVQIGANDGISSDPIRGFVTRNRVAGLAVEPLRDIFTRLVANYRDYPAVKPVNVALHRTAKSLEIHRVDPIKGKQLGDWTQGIGSFRPGHHELSNTPRELMVSETVRCVTFTELLQEHAVTDFDLLQIDTEGYDLEVIRMIDFQRHLPAIIRFEHGLPDGIMTQDNFRECCDLLWSHGYYVVTEFYDAIAYQPKLL